MLEGHYAVIPSRYFKATGSGIDLALLRRPRAVEAARRRAFDLPLRSQIRQRTLGRFFAVAFSTYERGDFTTVPNALFAPDCELRTADGTRLDLPQLAVGRDEITRWLALWHEPFSRVRWRPVEMFDGGDVLYVGVEMNAIGGASGAETQRTMYSVLWIRDAFVVSQFAAMDRAQALEAAGFS